MDQSTAISGMLKEREALNSPEGLSSPTYISERIQTLATYVGILELILADKESDLTIKEAAAYKSYLQEGKKTSPAKDLAKADFVIEHAEVEKLKRYISSSWRIVSTAQSRIKHLIEEAKSTV